MHGRNITFLSGLDGAEEFSIRPSAKMDHLLFTLGKQRRAVEYRLSDKNVVNSYFLPSHMSFSTPIIKHGTDSGVKDTQDTNGDGARKWNRN